MWILKVTLITIFFLINHFTIINSSTSFVAEIQRDESTSLYTLLLSLKTPLQPTTLLLDLSSKYSWIDCSAGAYISSTHHYIPCDSHKCNSLTSLACSNCFDQPGPGCHNNSCGLFPENPVIKNTVLAQALVDTVGLSVTDGYSVTGEVGIVPNFVLSCSDTSLLRGLPEGVSGLAGLGRFNYSLPSQVLNDGPLFPKTAVCLDKTEAQWNYNERKLHGGEYAHDYEKGIKPFVMSKSNYSNTIPKKDMELSTCTLSVIELFEKTPSASPEAMTIKSKKEELMESDFDPSIPNLSNEEEKIIMIEEENLDVEDITQTYVVDEVLNNSDDKHVEIGNAYVDLKHKVKKGFNYIIKVVNNIEGNLESLTRVTGCIYGAVTEVDIPPITISLTSVATTTEVEIPDIKASLILSL
ncbi:basic 7S globulin-like protein [Tanacetum coccineum]|uniref:Basic 7S globulin-like protein n=1 Tax=Tanacetum coccineum TaxID=301880 RepID=A0ABQ5DTJ8_9ASTR